MRRFLRNLPIKHKLMALTVAISGVALLVACAAFALYEQAAFRRGMARDFAILADMFDDNVASGLAFNDPAAIEQTLKTLSAHQRIVAACVYNKEGAVIGTYRRPDSGDGFAFPPARRTSQRFGAERLDTFKDIDLAGERIGVVYVGAELTELRERAWRYAAIVGLLLAGCSLVALALAARLQRFISQPIVDLAQTVATVAAGKNYAVRAPKHSDDELGHLIDGFNEMLGQIQTRDAALESARGGLEQRVEERTAELAQENAVRRRVEAELRTKTALLEAQQDSSIDGILVVDKEGKRLFQNQRMNDLLKIPPEIAQDSDDQKQIQFVATQTKHPGQFADKARYLYSHPTESSREEIELKDGTVLDRYSAPVVGKDGRHYGRIWGFRDITERKKAEEAVRESEERFSGAFEFAPIGVALVAPDGRWLRVNRAICELVGYTEAELLTRTFQDITHPDDLAADLESVRRLLAGEIRSYEMEKRYVHQRGHFVTILLNVSLVRYAQGQPRYLIAQIQDISARKQAETALRESNEKFHQLADNITDAFWIRSPDLSEVHYVSPAFERIWGRSVASLLANPQQWTEFILPEDRARVLDAFAKLTGDGPNLEIEYRIVRPDGEVRWIRVRGFQVREATGRLIRHIGIVTDITSWKTAEAALTHAHEELVGASRLAGMAEVATGVLHNVGNVLNSVNVSATLVADHVRHTKAGNIAKVAALFDAHTADLAEFLTRDPRGRMIPGYLGTLAESLTAEHTAVLRELDHLRKNVEHIKDIVAMQQSYARTSGVIETVSVPDLIEDALRINAGSLARHDIDTHRDYQARPVVTTDKHKVIQILINLVRNAKYACDESGRPDKLITVRTASDEHSVKIAIIDNGIGIPAENLTRIFSHGFTTRKDGHGFGLHSGALAARELGGSLHVQSAGVGHGATFTLELPFKPSPSAHENSNR